MLNQIHFLLTYTCNFECDHCFLYCSPRAEGTFTVAQIRDVLAEADKLGTVEWIYYEGGEPFLYFPVMVEGLRLARAAGLKTGVVTNCYWATGAEDAKLWLGPVVESGIDDLAVSDDSFHHGEEEGESPAIRAAGAATALGLPTGSICIEKPTLQPSERGKGEPVVGGGALFKGRAADKLTEGLPTRPSDSFTECPHEELVNPKRVHIDAFGNVQVCQGISIGNMWKTPLSEIINDYDADVHPICGPLSRGGPAALARTHGVELEEEGFVDECHHCFLVRRALQERFPDQLAPEQVYGISSDE
jgi:MoaA/NifB/PqqE/SkfB family radical SAM enzyme